ncbi:ADP-ribosylglycohydrolase family protein, partial [Bacillus sp. S34]|nr:ADP-ribosylglycohydrolase family protein [Bacillus sp. S34]
LNPDATNGSAEGAALAREAFSFKVKDRNNRAGASFGLEQSLAFQGLAIGDALGMPTQSMSLQQIREDHGRITGFV